MDKHKLDVMRKAAMRLPELPPVLDDRQRDLYARIASGPRGGVRGPLGLLLYSPDTAEHAQALGEFLRYRSSFPPRLSELIILIVARHLDCDYEWSAHAPIAERSGIPRPLIAAIAEGRPPDFDDVEQAAVFRFVDQLLTGHAVDDATFANFRELFGERGIVEATAIMGYYSLVAHLLNAARVPAAGETLPPRHPGSGKAAP